MTTITVGGATFTPRLVRDYRSVQESGNIVHELLSGNVDVTLAPASTRSGTLSFLFLTAAAAEACRAAHSAAAIATLTDTGDPTVNMTYVLPTRGRIDMRPEDDVDGAWTVTIDYRELP